MKAITYVFRFSAAAFCLAVLGLMTPALAQRRSAPQDAASRFDLENRARMAIKFEENQFKELLETCDELETTVKKFTAHYPDAPPPATPFFSEDDVREFKRIEKLAKKICSSQGDEDEDIAKTLPDAFPDQLKLLTDSTNELKGQVKKNSRHTISVGVITRTSRIIALMKRWMSRR